MFEGSGASFVGNRYGDLNQDAFSVHNGDSLDYGSWSVFDGHGMLGEHASRIAASTFEIFADGTHEDDDGVSTAKEDIISAFLSAHQNICGSYNVAPISYTYGKEGSFQLKATNDEACYQSVENPSEKRPLEYGTTALTMWKVKNSIFIGWVGDSKAIIGGLQVDGDPSSLVIEVIAPETKHTLKNPEERNRIRKETSPLMCIERNAVRIGNTVLDVTRALGHPLLCSTPEVVEIELKAHHQVAILATDGVWDHLSEDDAIKIALQNEDSDSAAREIIDAACSLNRDYKDQDNATAIVVYFDCM